MNNHQNFSNYFENIQKYPENIQNGTTKKVPIQQSECSRRDSNSGVACVDQAPRPLAHQSLHGMPGIGDEDTVILQDYIPPFLKSCRCVHQSEFVSNLSLIRLVSVPSYCHGDKAGETLSLKCGTPSSISSCVGFFFVVFIVCNYVLL